MNNIYLQGTYALRLLDEGAIKEASPSTECRFINPICAPDDIQEKLYRAKMPSTGIKVFVPQTARHAKTAGVQRFTRHEPFPPGTFYYLGNGIYAESYESFFARLAGRLPLPYAIRLGVEFCSDYSTLLSIPYQHFLQSKGYQGQNLVFPPAEWELSFAHSLYLAQRGFIQRPAPTTTRRIIGYLESAFAPQSRSSSLRAARYIEGGFKSPMEPRLYLLLHLPRRLGGCGLQVQVNRQFALGAESTNAMGRSHYEIDLLVQDAKYGIEYDGKHDHSKEEQLSFDRKKRYVLEREGIRIINLDARQMKDRQLLELYLEDIVRASEARSRGSRISPAILQLRRNSLWGDLFDYHRDLYRV